MCHHSRPRMLLLLKLAMISSILVVEESLSSGGSLGPIYGMTHVDENKYDRNIRKVHYFAQRSPKEFSPKIRKLGRILRT